MRSTDLLTLATCALILSPTLTYPMGLDQGTFAYLAAEALEGRWPYLATWDHQFPGGILLHALTILLLGKSIVMFRVADLVWQLANVFLIARLTGRLADAPAALLASTVYALVYQGYGPWNTGQREGYALTFMLIALYAYVTRERPRAGVTAVAIGLCIGFAATIKPTFLIFLAMYLPAWSDHPSAAVKLRQAGLALAASTVPMLGFIAFYWWLDGLGDMWEACVAYQTQVYVHRLRGDDPSLLHLGRNILALGPNPLALLIGYLPFFASSHARRSRLIVYIGLVCALLSVAVQGTFAGYHFLPGLALGAILLGTMYFIAAGYAARWVPLLRRTWVRTTAVLLVIGAAVPLYVRPQRVRALVTLEFLGPPRPDALRNPPVFDFYEDHRLAAYLKAHTSLTDPVQVWGHESLVYYLAERDAPSRFQSSNMLVMRPPGRSITPMQRRWRAEFIRDTAAHPPRYIAVATGDRWWWAPENRTSEELLSDFPEFANIIATHYRRDTTIGKFLVYRRVS